VDVDVPDGLSSRILLRQRLTSPHLTSPHLTSQQQHNRRRNGWLAFAASLILGLAVLLGVEHQIAEPSLEQAVLRHVNDELHHLKDNYDLDLAKLNRVLGDYGSKVESLSNRRINYAGACQMRRLRGAHLVIDGEQGPITVLLMPSEFVDAHKPIKDKRFQGVITPVENGSLAILGEDPKEVERLERNFVSQLRLIS